MKGVDSLIARWVDGELSDEESRELLRMLEEQPELQAQLAQQVMLDGMMGPVAEDEFSQRKWLDAVTDSVAAADADAFEAQVNRRIRKADRVRRFSLAAAAAAVIALVAGLWLLQPSGVATVVRVGPLDPAVTLEEGMTFHEGDTISLTSGLVELEMNGRGRMILEGPVEIDLIHDMHSSLKHGRALMRVTPEGHGYHLETPSGSVIDLGTEFGVSVDRASGVVETHVLDGEVKTLIGNEAPVHLHKDDALRFGPQAQERIPADPGSFYSALPPEGLGRPMMVNWPMELDASGIGRAEVNDFTRSQVDLIPMAMGQGRGPRRVVGRFGGATGFDGKGSFMESGFAGIGGSDPRTVCFWVKVPSDLGPKEGFAMVSWGDHRHEEQGRVWQVSINPLPADGPVGRLRVGAHGGMAIGSRDLRDDQWHHVAVVLYPVSKPNVGKHVMLYVDGELEAISNRTLGSVRTEVEDAAHGVWLGRNVTWVDDTRPPGHGGFFRGALDEVYILGGALSQSEIRSLMNDQEPW